MDSRVARIVAWARASSEPWLKPVTEAAKAVRTVRSHAHVARVEPPPPSTLVPAPPTAPISKPTIDCDHSVPAPWRFAGHLANFTADQVHRLPTGTTSFGEARTIPVTLNAARVIRVFVSTFQSTLPPKRTRAAHAMLSLIEQEAGGLDRSSRLCDHLVLRHLESPTSASRAAIEHLLAAAKVNHKRCIKQVQAKLQSCDFSALTENAITLIDRTTGPLLRETEIESVLERFFYRHLQTTITKVPWTEWASEGPTQLEQMDRSLDEIRCLVDLFEPVLPSSLAPWIERARETQRHVAHARDLQNLARFVHQERKVGDLRHNVPPDAMTNLENALGREARIAQQHVRSSTRSTVAHTLRNTISVSSPKM